MKRTDKILSGIVKFNGWKSGIPDLVLDFDGRAKRYLIFSLIDRSISVAIAQQGLWNSWKYGERVILSYADALFRELPKDFDNKFEQSNYYNTEDYSEFLENSFYDLKIKLPELA